MLDMVPFTSLRVTLRPPQHHPVRPDRKDIAGRGSREIEEIAGAERQLDPARPVVAPDAPTLPSVGNDIDRGRGHRSYRAERGTGGALYRGPGCAIEVPDGAVARLLLQSAPRRHERVPCHPYVRRAGATDADESDVRLVHHHGPGLPIEV